MTDRKYNRTYTEYTVNEDVKAEEWPAIHRDLMKGEKLYGYVGHTYGLDRDDAMAGYEVIACTYNPGEESFFTVPVDILRTEDGEKPMGAYVLHGANWKDWRQCAKGEE